MRLHIVTIGKPKRAYAVDGLKEYAQRLGNLHTLRITHIPDKHNDAKHILDATEKTFKVALVINAKQKTSEELAEFLKQKELDAREVSFIVGGPDGLPEEVINQADAKLGLSKLTFPHDLAMVILAETLYRASSINNKHPYHH